MTENVDFIIPPLKRDSIVFSDANEDPSEGMNFGQELHTITYDTMLVIISAIGIFLFSGQFFFNLEESVVFTNPFSACWCAEFNVI
jgi:hypothetical protein